MSSDNQRDILLKLIQGDIGQKWAEQNEGWGKDDLEVCYWTGINCDSETESQVEGIYLPASNFIGSLPSELGQLTKLKEIAMPKNVITGTIPSSIAALPHLEIFNLQENDVDGHLPSFSSVALRELILSKNNLMGTLPESIGDRNVNLENLDVFDNKLTGTLPASLAKLTKIQFLSLSQNEFSGMIPTSLGNVKNLKYLYLNDNFLIGTIPPSIASYGSTLEEIWLQHNALSGTVPAALGSITLLHSLYLDGNKFTGTIPEDICNESLNTDFFQDAPPTAEKDYCEAVACPTGMVSFDGLFPCKPCTNREHNPYLGRQGRCIDMKVNDILKDLYNSMGGENWNGALQWDLKDYDDAKHCDFPGVECDSQGHVTVLDLSGMGLSGTIPESLGFLEHLEKLNLKDNNLTGFLPSDLRWAPLSFLDVSGNQLKGMVPPMLCLKAGINGNGNGGEFGCEHIACPVGTFSASGHGVAIGSGEKCKPCNTATFLGTKICETPSLLGSEVPGDSLSIALGGVAGACLVVAAVVFIVIKVMRVRKVRQDSIFSHRDDDWSFETPQALFTVD